MKLKITDRTYGSLAAKPIFTKVELALAYATVFFRCIRIRQGAPTSVEDLLATLSQTEAEEAVCHNSNEMNKLLSARQFPVDVGNDPLIDAGTFKEGVPVRGSNELNSIP